MKKFMLYLVALLLPALPVFAAVEALPNPVGEAVAGLLTNVVFPVLSALLLGFVGVILNKVRIKYGLEVSAEHQAMIERAALSGIAYAEEKAAAVVKAKATKITGKEKLDLAVAHMLAAVPKISQAQAEAVVGAVLGKISGAGATGRAAVPQ